MWYQVCLKTLILVELALEQAVQRWCVWDDLCQPRADDAGINASEEECHTPTELGYPVAMRIRNAFDQAMQAQTPQMIGHLSLGEMIWVQAQQGCEQSPQLVIGKPARQKPKSEQSA